MKTVQVWLDEYGQSHRNAANKRLHWICVPPIALSVIGLMRALPFGDAIINGASIGILLTLAYYCALSWRLALGIAPVFAAMYALVQWSYAALGPRAHCELMIAVFVLAWIGQFVGHKFEGARPSFFKDVQFLLIGPLWLLSDVYRRLHLGIDGSALPAAR